MNKMFRFSFAALLFMVSCMLSAQGEIPIMASHTILSNDYSIENYKAIEECGYTLARENYPSRDIAIQHLKAALKSKVKLIIGCPEILSDMAKTVQMFNEYSSFGGYYLYDEPTTDEFVLLSDKVKRLKELDNRNYIWINIFPIVAQNHQLKSDSYKRYLDDYLKIVKPPFLSFDCYGILKSGLISNYYLNLEMVSSCCKEKGVPFWAYVLSSQFGDYEYPTKGVLSFQAYNNLAYGAQGIEYFSYRRILGHGLNMTIAPVNIDYKKMSVFDTVKELNSEIRYYSKFLYRSDIQEIAHLCKELPAGTKRLENLPKGLLVETYNSDGFVVSQFKKSGKMYIMFVNKDYNNSQVIAIFSKTKIRRISCYKSERQKIHGHQTINIKAGSILLLRLS